MFYENIHLYFQPIASGPRLHICVPAAPITIFVGPNGAGKSTAVRDLANTPDKAFIACGRTLSKESLEFYHHKYKTATSTLSYTEEDFKNLQSSVTSLDLQFRNRSPGNILHLPTGKGHKLTAQFYHYLDDCEKEQRLILSVSNSITQIADGPRGAFKGPPGSRLDVLFRDRLALASLRSRISEMFGLFPVIDASQGHLQLRFSRSPPPEGLEQSITPENEAFMDAAQQHPHLSDGTRTYIALWGHLLSGNERLIFLDEAGAFLHPPLARKLGKDLTQLAVERNGHVFAATHSPDFVLGCVQAGCKANVIRLTHRNNSSTARLLSADNLLPLMRDPLLRSSNIISGLFHDGVIICEADADRAFYQEINERLLDEREGLNSCHFVNAQNWQTIPRITSALRNLGIPAAQLVDLDAVIHEDSRFLLESAGVPTIIARGLGQVRGELARAVSDRKELKEKGLDAVPDDLKGSWRQYLQDLSGYGIFAVPVGELEGWFPEFNIPRNRKGEWIVRTFEKMGSDQTSTSYLRPTNGGPWEFMRAVSRWILDPERKGIPTSGTTDKIICSTP